MATATYHVDKQLKQQATELYESMGMSLSTAINVFLRQSVREQRMPFTPSVGMSYPAPVSAPAPTPAPTSGTGTTAGAGTTSGIGVATNGVAYQGAYQGTGEQGVDGQTDSRGESSDDSAYTADQSTDGNVAQLQD